MEKNVNRNDVYISTSDPEKSDPEQVAEKGDSQQDMKRADELYNEIEKKQRVYSTQKIKTFEIK